jgi:hypothetical protein
MAVKDVKKMGWVMSLMTALVIMSLYSVAVQSGAAPTVKESRENALDTALNFILNSHEALSELQAPPKWVHEGLVYEDIVGYTIVQYSSGKWTAEVGNTAIQEPIYDIEIVFTGEQGFIWKGTVDQNGNVVETEFVLGN